MVASRFINNFGEIWDITTEVDMAKNKCGKWIRQAIRRIEEDKKRPSTNRICRAVRKAGHDISDEILLEQLELRVRNGKIQRINRKGIESYQAVRRHRKGEQDEVNVKVADVSDLEQLNVSTTFYPSSNSVQ